jgi:hypothetical protein
MAAPTLKDSSLRLTDATEYGIPPSASSITGSGTPTDLAMFTGSNVIGDSSIQVVGSGLFFAGLNAYVRLVVGAPTTADPDGSYAFRLDADPNLIYHREGGAWIVVT